MIRRFTKSTLLVASATIALPALGDESVINYEDHIKPIFREHCVSCHSQSDKSSGLSLDNYGSALEGGSGGASLVASDSSASRLWRLMNHEEQPTMPPDQDKIDAKQLELVKTWIDQGMPENSGSQIKRKKVQVAAAVMGANGRPEGPVPMPSDLLLETPRRTEKAAAIAALGAAPWSPFVAVGGQMQVSLYHVESGELLGVVPFPEGEPQSITFSRDGRLMLVGGGQHSKKGVAALYDVTTGKRLTTLGDEIDIVMAADISDDNSKVAIAGPQRIVRVYDVATGNQLHELKKHTDWIYALRFSPDGLFIASADRSNGMVIWETDTGRMYLDLIGHKGEIRSLDWRADSLVLYSASMDNTVKMWDMNNGGIIKSWDAHGGGVTAIDVANDGTIATTGRDNLVKIWDGAGNAAGQMPNLAEAGMEVAISVDSQYVVAGDWLGNVRRWKRDKVDDEKLLPANPPTLEMQISTATQQRDALATARDAAKAEFEQLNTLVTTTQQSLEVAKASMAQLDQTIGATQQSMAAVEPKISAIQQQIAQGNQAMEAKFAENLDLSNKLAVIKAQQQSIQAQVASLQIDPNTPTDEATATANAAKVAELGKQLESITATVDTMSMQVVEKQKEIDALEAQIETMRTSLMQESNAMAVHKATHEQLAAERAQADKALQDMTLLMNNQVAQRDAAAAKLASQDSLVANAQSKFERLTSQVSRIEAERASFLQQAQTMEQRLSEIKNAQVAMTEQKNAAQQAVDAKLAQMAELQKQIDAMLAAKAEMEKEKGQLETKLSEVNNQVKLHEDQAAEVMGEMKASSEEKALFDAAYPVIN